MTEAHAKKLSSAMPSLSDPIQKDAMVALLKEENDRAEQLRNKLRLLATRPEAILYLIAFCALISAWEWTGKPK